MQILVIQGGTSAFMRYEDFLEQMRIKPLTLEKYTRNNSDWKKNLHLDLGEGYTVLLPNMPNRDNAHYVEWKIWFERSFPYLKDGVVLIGHSLGGLFLAKYLSEEKFPKKIKATFLVAAPFESGGMSRWEKKTNEFALADSLALFEGQSGSIFLYHSKDDTQVPYDDLAKYKQALPQARVTVFENRNHINQEEFPEIIEDIKSLQK